MTVRPLRIGFVLDRFDPGIGGMERALAGLFEHLTRRGHSIGLYAMEWSGDGPSGLDWTRVRAGGPRAWREVTFARRALAAARDEGCDVVVGLRHSPGVDVYYPHGGSWVDSWERKVAGYPAPAQALRRLAANLSPKQRVFRAAERAIFDDARTRIIAVSEMVRGRLVDAYGVDPERIDVVPNGVDSDRFHPADGREDLARLRRDLGCDDGATLFLHVSHNFRLKGLEWLIHAAKQLRDEGHSFRIAVLGRDAPGRYIGLSRRLGVGELVRFPGVSAEPERRYRAADVFVLPTYHDPCSLATLEAMASGLPVITTRFNGAVPPGSEGGIVFEDPADVGALAGAMRSLLDPADRSARAAAARRDVRGLSWSRCFDAVEAVLVRAAAEREGKGA